MRLAMTLAMRLLSMAALALSALPQKLPLGEVPRGKVVLILQPHHDDHTTDYGMGGLIARMVDEGYEAYYVRASNDEKDGAHGYARNDIVNLRESVEGTRILGIRKVISLNWRNDYMNPIPLNELREQLIVLIRKYKPDVVLGHNPWEHYQKNPDHRQVARAMAEAWWMAGFANVHPEHAALGLQPHSAHYLYGKARLDWGLGHRPNVAIELNESQVRKKQKAYVAHLNVYANPATARAYRVALARENLAVPEWESLTDAEAAVLMEEWHMEWISRRRGAEAGVPYAEDYYVLGEFDHLPGLKEYLSKNVVAR